MHRSADRPNGQAGFTLVELLVVTVILGVFAAVVVFALGEVTDRAGTSADKADIRAMEVAEANVYSQNLATGSPTYVSETQLVRVARLRSLSSKYDICLRSDSRDYFVDLAGSDCSRIPAPHTGTFNPAP